MFKYYKMMLKIHPDLDKDVERLQGATTADTFVSPMLDARDLNSNQRCQMEKAWSAKRGIWVNNVKNSITSWYPSPKSLGDKKDSGIADPTCLMLLSP
jgi:hypothetical protein